MALTTLRIHSYTADNEAQFEAHAGTVACDFRGPNFIGDNEGDHHKTLFEKDVDDTDALVAEVLAIGPRINQLFASLEAIEPSGIPGGKIGLRIGVWSKQAEGG